uniref:Large ribosomal subunit protein mL50 n=1 Tax=Panagrellus redivivus TaxID=6233 RepID=A0A7E4VD12_PANRE
MLSRTLIILPKRCTPSLSVASQRFASDAPQLTPEQKEKLRSILPSFQTGKDVKAVPPKTKSFDLDPEVNVEAEMDQIRARGFLKYSKPYSPPANVKEIVSSSIQKLFGSSDLESVAFGDDLELKFKILTDLSEQLGLSVPNSDLHKLQNGADVLEFYSTPKENLTSYAKLARDDSKPGNLAVREHPARFHPDDVEAVHGGITAYPGEGGQIISLRNQRLYRSFKPKKEWYDYEDQAFDYTPPDSGMPWDPAVSRKMDRYVDKKFKLNSLK